MPAWLIPAIGAGASILGNWMTGQSQARQNELGQQFAREMYGRQRADTLADWNMQNEYNSPSAQMQRLKAAGLNPNLVYGSGADAGMAAPVRSSQAGSWRPEATRYSFEGVGQSLMSFYDVQQKEAVTDNLKAQNTVLVQDALLKAAQIAGTQAGVARSEFDLQLAKDLRVNTIEAAQENVRKLMTGTDIALREDERAAAQSSMSLRRAAEEILSIRANREKVPYEKRLLEAQVRNVQNDSTLKELDANLKRLGIQPSDALWQRMLAQLIGDGKVTETLRRQVEKAGSQLRVRKGDSGMDYLRKMRGFFGGK